MIVSLGVRDLFFIIFFFFLAVWSIRVPVDPSRALFCPEFWHEGCMWLLGCPADVTRTKSKAG